MPDSAEAGKHSHSIPSVLLHISDGNVLTVGGSRAVSGGEDEGKKDQDQLPRISTSAYKCELSKEQPGEGKLLKV